MLTPEYYESCSELILQQYADLEDAILRDIIRRIMKTGVVTESAKWQAEMLQEAGLVYNDIVKSVSQHTGMIAEEVQRLFEDAGVETVEADNVVYRQMDKEPKSLLLSAPMMQVLEAGYRKTLGQLDNLTATMPSAGQRMYINACNQAYMKVTSGAFSYQQAVMQAVKETAASGLKVVEYDSGRSDRLEVAVLRAVRTGVAQTCREVGRMNAEENGCELMEITAHSGARPEHARWQGQLVDLTGRRRGETIDGLRVLSLSDIGYGQITGFGGVNCRHDWYPYFEGYSVPNYTQERLEELNARNIEYNGKMHTQYEISQMQRAQERKIRELKRRAVTWDETAKTSSDAEIKSAAQKKYTDSAVKLKAAEQKLSDFCKATGQDRDRFREQVNGFGRPQAQRAVWTAKKSQKALTFGSDSGIMKTQKASSGGKIQWKPKGKDLTAEQRRELTEYASSKGITLTGLAGTDVDAELLKEAVDDAAFILDLHPELRGSSGNPFTIKIVNGMDANDFAMTYKRERNIIRLNANAYRDKQKLQEEYQRLVDLKWFVQGTSYRSIIKHELGHVYANVHKIDGLKLAKDLLQMSGDETLMYVMDNLSLYSGCYSDGSEIISEVFSSYYGGNPKAFERNFIALLKEDG
ncbi:MAG: phage minor capsid protein [Ruminococcus sp.]|nr:phage minor capsid protein [Ruminococcus sp.]